MSYISNAMPTFKAREAREDEGWEGGREGEGQEKGREKGREDGRTGGRRTSWRRKEEGYKLNLVRRAADECEYKQ